MSESKKNTLTKSEENMLKIFRLKSKSTAERIKLAYVVMEKGWTLEKAQEFLWVLEKTSSLDAIDTYIELYESLEKYREHYSWDYEYRQLPSLSETYSTLLHSSEAGKLRSSHVIKEVIRSIECNPDPDSIELIIEVVTGFNKLNVAEEDRCIVKVLKILNKMSNCKYSERADLVWLLIFCKSHVVIQQAMELWERDCPYKCIDQLIYLGRESAASQSRLLSRELLKRRLLGTVRSVYSSI